MTTIVNPNKALWEKGDFTQIAATMRRSGEELVARLDLTPGTKVLDVGCGDGTTALPEARFGAAGIPADRIECAPQTYTFEFDGTPTELLARFRDYYGPTMNAYAAAGASGKTADLQRELEELFTGQNASGDPTTTSIPATFL